MTLPPPDVPKFNPDKTRRRPIPRRPAPKDA